MECKDEMIRSLQLSYSLSINLAIVESCTFVVPSYMVPDKRRDKTQRHVLLSSSLGPQVALQAETAKRGGEESWWHLALTLWPGCCPVQSLPPPPTHSVPAPLWSNPIVLFI